jgi:dinuclear metal center YbgI/SA1388 family protein
MLVSEVLQLLNRLAPTGLASSWDNVGLQVGQSNWQAKKILLTLDVTPSVVDYAIKQKFELIISHHPFIFRPISTATSKELIALIQAQVAVIAMHTNLDVVPDGVNYALANTLGLKVTGNLSSETGSKWYHGSVSVPPLYLDKLAEAIHSAGAGRIGLYDRCSTRHSLEGTFRALNGSNPFLGKTGQFEKVDEVELEFMVDSFNLSAVKRAITDTHPYETPAYYFTETENSNPTYGLGLVCTLAKPLTLKQLAQAVKEKLKAPYLQLWTAGMDEGTKVSKVAICGGAGGSLIAKATALADVFITGDINYHAMLESKIPLINAGHFYTEYPILQKLSTILKEHQIKTTIYPISKHEINYNLII